MAKDLRPTTDAPGLHVNGGTRYTAPTGEYACRCGAIDSAKGDTAVTALIEAYSEHKASHGRERSAR